jgi:putative transposase
MNLTRDDMETRRLAAAKLFKAGASAIQVGELFDVSRNSAGRWKQLLREEGIRALKKSVAPGRPSRLNEQQRMKLKQLCERGPQAAGYDSSRWTTAMLADAIQEQLGIQYHPDHVGKLLHRMGVEWMPWHRQKTGQAN